MRFGRLPADPAALARAPKLATHLLAAMEPSPRIDRSAVPFHPRQFWNGALTGPSQQPELPDCTAAAVANLALAVSALNGFETKIDDARVPAFYGQCIGMPSATPEQLAATGGAVMLDVMRRVAVQGFETGAQLLVPRFGVLPLDQMRIAAAVDRLGGAALGITLYARDMEVAGSDTPWDETGADPGAVEGGHCLLAWDYTGLRPTDLVRLVTWGGMKAATWRWVMARTREAYGVIFPALGQTDGVSLGVDAAALDAELTGMAA